MKNALTASQDATLLCLYSNYSKSRQDLAIKSSVGVPHFVVYNVLPCTHVLGPNFQEKIFCFNFLIPLLIYLYLETKPVIIFQGIILHTDIVIVF